MVAVGEAKWRRVVLCLGGYRCGHAWIAGYMGFMAIMHAEAFLRKVLSTCINKPVFLVDRGHGILKPSRRLG